MFRRTSGIVSSLSFLLVSIVLGASSASAEVHIFEVQVVPANDPQKLVIWGTDFGTVSSVDQTPVIHLGTETDPLVISGGQSLCFAAPPPPLESGYECVVAKLPIYPIPAGDYLLWLDGLVPMAGCDTDAQPIALTFQYTGDDCSVSNNSQQGKSSCNDIAGGPLLTEPVQVLCDDGDCTADPSGASVLLSGTVTLTGSGGMFSKKTNIEIRDQSSVSLQELAFDGSCSSSLEVGDIFGSLTLLAYIPIGAAAPSAHYDLTIGGIPGPAGPPGPATATILVSCSGSGTVTCSCPVSHPFLMGGACEKIAGSAPGFGASTSISGSPPDTYSCLPVAATAIEVDLICSD